MPIPNNNIHNQEREQFKYLFQQENIDHFEERYKILEIFLQNERHVTVEQLSDILKNNGYEFEPKLVSDTLRLMCDFGFARKNRFNDENISYEHHHLGQHHDHMVCTKCKKVIEFENNQLENLQMQIAGSHGFHVLQHKMEIYGICEACLPDRINQMPLVMAKPGEQVVIKKISGGYSARIRMMTMGLRAGDLLDVITNVQRGQVIVASNFQRYVIGRGLAEKIFVQHADHNKTFLKQPVSHQKTDMRLSEMLEGQTGIITYVGGNENRAIRRRILEMGLIKGAEVYVEKYAPLKDPIELIVKGYHISLRVEEACHITVNHIR